MTSTAEEELISLYEISGLSVEEIAAEMSIDQGIVRLALSGGSHLYRARVEQGREENVSKEEEREAMEVVKNVMRDQEKSGASTRLKAAIFLVDERRGRNDARARMGNNGSVNVNMVILQRHLQGMKMARRAIKAPSEVVATPVPV